MLEATDLSTLGAEQLHGMSSELYNQGDNSSAAVVGQWAVHKGADGRYNLACYLALCGQIEPSFYFLQEAARLEGVDPGWAAEDPDLKSLRKDPRWSSVDAYLQELRSYWATQKVLKTSLIAPQNLPRERPIPVVVWLHGMGANESIAADGYQALADEMGIAFVGVSGTIPLGPKAFRWSEDLERDGQQVRAALDSLSDKLTPAPGKTVLFGFSQGAQLAFALSIKHPDLYCGAIALSPGWLAEVSAPSEGSSNAKQRYVLVAGAGEHPDTVALTRQDALWCKERKAEARVEIIADLASHAFPPDFFTQFGPWLAWVTETASRS
jgi:predicted esterase